MSGVAVGHALEIRFEEVRRAEADRLRHKLAALSPGDRVLAEAIITDVIGALARVPAAALSRPEPPPALDAVAHRFGLDGLT